MVASRAKLDAALAECALHAQVLEAATAALPGSSTAEMAIAVDADRRRWLDQVACRFMKLQDSLGEKVWPGLLAATLDPLPPEATFAERLQRLGRLGALPSVERWRLLREVRNSLAHEYPEHADLQAAALTRLVGGARELLLFWQAALAFAGKRLTQD
jgi:hypothetical protein